MRVDFLDQMYYGNYRFTVELDTGSETGINQLTVWAAEKCDIDDVPLAKFTLEQLLHALLEPQKSRLLAQLAEEKRVCQQELIRKPGFGPGLKRLQIGSRISS